VARFQERGGGSKGNWSFRKRGSGQTGHQALERWKKKESTRETGFPIRSFEERNLARHLVDTKYDELMAACITSCDR